MYKSVGQSLRGLALASAVAVAAFLSPMFVASAAAAEKPTTKPSPSSTPSKPAKRTAIPAEVTKAIADLNKEFADFAAKPDSDLPRTTSDYFKSGLPEGVTADDILAALEKGMSGSAPQVSYVKWQLLSGLSAKVEGEQAGRIYSLYRSAPQPLARFSADVHVKQQLDRMLQGLKQGQEDKLNEQFAAQAKMVDDANAPVLDYRNGLYSRLPTTADSLVARLQDGAVRMQAGVDAKKIIASFGEDVRSWIAVNGNPNQANAILGAMKEIKNVKGPEIYTVAEWNEKTKKMGWKKGAAAVDAKQLDPVEKSLKDFINNPQANTLKFKDK